MDGFFEIGSLWLFLVAIPVGVFAVLIGASQFLSIPLFQLFFPQMTLGAIVGNLRIGNMLRDLVALIPVYRSVQFKTLGTFIVVICIGSIIGTLGTISLPQTVLLPILLFAVVVTEAAPWISSRVHRHALLGAFFLTGVYYGVIGAGGSVITLAFLRVQYPQDHHIHAVRVHMLLLEFCAFAVSVAAFVLTGRVDWVISLVWAAGAMIGGYIGGIVLKHTGKTKPRTQKIFLRAVYCVAIGVALWRLFTQ